MEKIIIHRVTTTSEQYLKGNSMEDNLAKHKFPVLRITNTKRQPQDL